MTGQDDAPNANHQTTSLLQKMNADFATTCNRTKRFPLASRAAGVAALLALLPSVSAEGLWQWERLGQDGGPGRLAYSVVAWTGEEILVWGGRPPGLDIPWRSSGWRYAPRTHSWSPMSSLHAPTARSFPIGVWTGKELMIWGGRSDPGGDSLRDGACYDPVTDTWRPTSMADVPSTRSGHTMVWTGTEVLVWGGLGNGKFRKDGGRYDPRTNSWLPMSREGAPAVRWGHTAIWTGSEMIVWGGDRFPDNFEKSFGNYNPSTDRWTVGNSLDAPPKRSGHSAVWTGSEMIIWGGWNGSYYHKHHLADGASYRPDTRTWTVLPLTGAPEGRSEHTSAWTGREMIVWGGDMEEYSNIQTGGRFNPSTGLWSSLPPDESPGSVWQGTAAWSGEAFYVYREHLTRAHETGPYALDGIPDDWQYQYFGAQHPDGEAGQDPDSDGQPNTFECLAGTVPTDPRSRLEFSLAVRPVTGELQFAVFPGRMDRRYWVEQSTGLNPPEWHAVEGTWNDLGNMRWILSKPRPSDRHCFYRLGLERK